MYEPEFDRADEQIYEMVAVANMLTSTLSGDLIMLTSTLISRSFDVIAFETQCMADNSSMKWRIKSRESGLKRVKKKVR